jgi:hypothetical protein
VATVGITDYAQDALGEIVFCELPEVGDEFDLGGTCPTSVSGGCVCWVGGVGRVPVVVLVRFCRLRRFLRTG